MAYSHYLAELCLATIRAIIWAGSVWASLPRWLIVFGAGLVLGLRQLPEQARPILRDAGLGWLLDLTPWSIVACGLLLMVILLGFRVAQLETSRIIFGRPTLRPDSQGNLIGRVPISLASMPKEQGRISLQLFNLDSTPYDDEKYVLLTEERLKKVRNGERRYVGLINFDTLSKNVELIQYDNALNHFVIEHESGTLKIPPSRCYKLRLTVVCDHGQKDNILLMMSYTDNVVRLSDSFSGEERQLP